MLGEFDMRTNLVSTPSSFSDSSKAVPTGSDEMPPKKVEGTPRRDRPTATLNGAPPKRALIASDETRTSTRASPQTRIIGLGFLISGIVGDFRPTIALHDKFTHAFLQNVAVVMSG